MQQLSQSLCTPCRTTAAFAASFATTDQTNALLKSVLHTLSWQECTLDKCLSKIYNDCSDLMPVKSSRQVKLQAKVHQRMQPSVKAEKHAEEPCAEAMLLQPSLRCQRQTDYASHSEHHIGCSAAYNAGQYKVHI